MLFDQDIIKMYNVHQANRLDRSFVLDTWLSIISAENWRGVCEKVDLSSKLNVEQDSN